MPTAPAPTPAPPPERTEQRCASCGYGALLPPGPAVPCPMCRGARWLPRGTRA
jgi:hypothetical protein